MSRSGAAASIIGRVVGHVSPPRPRVTDERELTAEEQDEIVQVFKVICKGVYMMIYFCWHFRDLGHEEGVIQRKENAHHHVTVEFWELV